MPGIAAAIGLGPEILGGLGGLLGIGEGAAAAGGAGLVAGGAGTAAAGGADLLGLGSLAGGAGAAAGGADLLSGGGSDLLSGVAGSADAALPVAATPASGGIFGGIFPGGETPIGFGDAPAASVGGATNVASGANTAGTSLGALTGAAPGTGAAAVGGIPGVGGATDIASADIAGQEAIINQTLGGLEQTNAGLPAAGGNSLQSLISDPLGTLGKGAADSLTKNPLGIALGGAGLGAAILGNKQQSNAVNQLEYQAQALGGPAQNAIQQGTQGLQTAAAGLVPASNSAITTGQQLQGYQTSGTLPPALQQQVDQQVSAAIQQRISQAVAAGQNGDPNQNSVLASDIQNIRNNGIALAGTLQQQLAATGTADINTGIGGLSNAGSIASSLVNAGISAAGISSGLLQTLAGLDQAQTAAVGKAIANFAAAMSPGGVKLQIGGTQTV